ncbi:unnamed protein product [Lota lota]
MPDFVCPDEKCIYQSFFQASEVAVGDRSGSKSDYCVVLSAIKANGMNISSNTIMVPGARAGAGPRPTGPLARHHVSGSGEA